MKKQLAIFALAVLCIAGSARADWSDWISSSTKKAKKKTEGLMEQAKLAKQKKEATKEAKKAAKQAKKEAKRRKKELKKRAKRMKKGKGKLQKELEEKLAKQRAQQSEWAKKVSKPSVPTIQYTK